MTKDDRGYAAKIEQLRGWIKEELQQMSDEHAHHAYAADFPLGGIGF